MRSVLLRLAGPLQSWGTQGRFGVRDTDREPSKSGILGLVGAALGMQRDDRETLRRLRSLELAVRVDREGTPLRDFHTIGGGTFRGKPHRIWSIEKERPVAETALTHRYYLSDASFLAALGSDDLGLVDEVASALRNPVWPMFLGRRSCPPAEPVFSGTVELPPEEALRAAPIAQVDVGRVDDRLRLVLEASAYDGSPRQDDPEQFDLYARKHGLRYVRMEFVDRDSLPSEVSP